MVPSNSLKSQETLILSDPGLLANTIGKANVELDMTQSLQHFEPRLSVRNRRVTHNTPKTHFCKMMLIALFGLVLIKWFRSFRASIGF